MAKYVPDYDDECVNCGQSPTVTVEESDGTVSHRTNLCGPCCWGEASTLEVDTWNE